MAFVNEIASEEDIQKYELDALMREFNSWAWREGRPSTFVHAWTIDRERNIYFIPVKTVEEVGPSGRNEPTSRKVCILNWGERRFRALIELSDESSKKVDEVPVRIVWKLLELDPPAPSGVSRDKIVETLKEALIAYGHRGAHMQLANTVVEFKF